MPRDTTATSIPLELLGKYDRPGPRYTSYPTAPEWNEEVGTAQYRTALTAAAQNAEPIAVYCHIPFCRRRCYYCGCNTYVVSKQSTVADYIAALIAEIKHVAGLLENRRPVNQLHFGGGTPTFLDNDDLKKILQVIEERFKFSADCERSIELDPRVTTSVQLEFLARHGFNRASIGVQDFDPQVLEAAGRVQSEDQVRTVIEACRELTFKGINIDLIYGLPRQTVAGFSETIDKVIALRPDRLAVYSFAYLPKVKPHQSVIKPEDLPPTKTKYELFATAIEKFTAAGYRQIGMDHFALPDDELALAQADGGLHRNFMGYTIQTAPEMLGFGMSAIGYVDDTFFQNVSQLQTYITGIAENGLAVYRGKKLSADDLVRKYVITSLMCNLQLNFKRLKSQFGIDYQEYFGDEQSRLAGFFADGLLSETEVGLEITSVGRTFVRNIAMTFDAYLSRGDRKTIYSRTI